ncbi:MAG: hypothetical protein UU80_C0017G0020 [candidate division WWE3 bacterium GW2011_GWA1_41_8]|uniref:Uncharacterized protein n=2 Tax=Katanobacteria TaxID=422282 RepID=A0A0G0XAA3_UNCKA|nr:MAG: hypothetical protein UU72_C0013G0025 [candidate division WWE3 bacterium GW2011_GWB1_41_6]KKS21919.1 MAG: hypothetical protein UU80_C0017G0020 [candidate division WWE3 bacterium GW2011_GWA1_41_8]
MTEKKLNLIDTLLNLVPVLLAFLMPVFFLPITSEFFEFNKFALLAVTTSVLLILWVLSMIQNKRVYVTRSVLDVGLVLVLVSFVLSSVFSVHKVSSIFGSYGRWFPSLFSFAILLAFYYVVSANLRSSLRTVYYALIAGSTLSTLVALLSYFGIKLGSAVYFQSVNFNLTGSSTTAALVAVVGALLAMILMIRTNTQAIKMFLLQAVALNMLGVALLGTWQIWTVFAVGLLAAFYFLPGDTIRSNKTLLLALGGIFTAFVLIFAMPTTREVLVNSNYPREITLPAKESQVVAFSVLRDYPLLGSGPSTFYLNYPNYKSLAMNATTYWNVRFDKPFSEAFNILSSLGLIGILMTALFAVRLLKVVAFAKKSEDNSGLLAAAGTGLIVMSAYFLLAYANVLTAFLFMLFLATSVALASVFKEKRVGEDVSLGISSFSSDSSMSILNDLGERKEIFPYIVSAPVVGLVALGMFQLFRMYSGEYYIRQAIAAAAQNNGSLTYQMQVKAININPRRDAYHNAYAQTNMALANTLASKPDLTDQEKVTIQTLIAQAIRSSRVTTETLNPTNVANWETRAFVYRALVGVAKDADQWAINAYNSAIQLDPSNPRLRLDLGGLYYAKEDYLSAASFFRQATSLKPDYANAHYNFGHALMKLNAYADAQREFELVLRMVPADTADYTKASADLETAKTMAVQAGSKAQPTVEQLEGSAIPVNGQSDAQKQTQESLIKPGEEERIESLPVNSTSTTTPSAPRR